MKRYKSIFKEGYQGYSNYETWNICLWAFNDENTYKALLSEQPFDLNSAENFIKSMFPNGTPDMKNARGYNKVNWQEVMNCLNEE